jgi:acetyl-CoA synthetase
MAKELLHWIKPFDQVCHGEFAKGNVGWFLGGQLNVAYNCIDRHALEDPNKVAIIWEADEPGQHQHITYGQLLDNVCKFANVLKKFNVKKGDRVCIYLPMVPEAAYAMLACARIGAVHSVVFAGFSAEALRNRILDADCQVVINVKTSIIYQRAGDPSVPFLPGRDVWWHEEMVNVKIFN